MSVIRTPNFESTDLEFVPFDRSPELSEEITQTLARLLGWDYVNNMWRRLRVDASGSIGVVIGPATTSALECTNVAVAGAADLLAAANTARRSIRIRNLGADPIVIDDTAAVVTTTGFPIPPGGEWYSDTYRGDLFALVDGTAANVRVIEER